MKKKVVNLFKVGWAALRFILQDDAYDRYLAHFLHASAHQGDQPLSRKEFFKQELNRKWNGGINRCC